MKNIEPLLELLVAIAVPILAIGFGLMLATVMFG